jgi:hypothetical protein
VAVLLPVNGAPDELPSVAQTPGHVPGALDEVFEPAQPAAETAADTDTAHDTDAATVYEFGEVIRGTLVQHSFALRSDGERALRITGTRESCGCTVATVPDAVVPPGEVGHVDVTFDTARFQGRQTKTVLVLTDDPDRPVVELTLAGVVTADLVAEPPVVYFGRIDPGTGATAEIKVRGADAGPLDLVAEVEGGGGAIALDVEPQAAAENSSRRVVVRIGPAMAGGPFSETVRIRVNGGSPSEIAVPILGTVERDLVTLPAQVTLRTATPSSRSRRAARGEGSEVRVRNLGVVPVAISGVRVPDFPLDYAVRTVHAGFEYLITLRLATADPLGDERHGLLHIYTTHPDESELVVPVYALGPPAGF